MPRHDWDEFLRASRPAHLVAGLVPRTANAARLGRPGRVNLSWSAVLETVVTTLRPQHGYSIAHLPDDMGSVVLCAFEHAADADRLAELTRAVDDPRQVGAWAELGWASRRCFLFDRHARRELVDHMRGVEPD
ncbi:MAG TPA: hypothetical protein VEC14_05790 [Reyranellaceae bacterium]|nr:hypothetical protein [Reyranellaceae bacterium]